MMGKNEVTEKLKNILISVLKHQNFEMLDNVSAADVNGWDSLNHIIIITEVEKVFAIKFKLRELSKLDNIGSLVELVYSKHRSGTN